MIAQFPPYATQYALLATSLLTSSDHSEAIEQALQEILKLQV